MSRTAETAPRSAYPAPEACDVVLAPSYAQAKNWNMAHRGMAGTDDAGLFGTIAQTFAEWLAGIWELYGNGCRLISDPERSVLAQRVLDERPLESLAATPNLGAALASCARYGSGIPSFDAAVQDAAAGNTPRGTESGHAAPLADAECELLARIGAYCAAAQDANLIEPGAALAYLVAHCAEAFPEPCTVWCLDGGPLPLQERLFLESVPNLHVRFPANAVSGHLEAVDRGRVRFAFPAGRYAQAPLVLQAIEDLQRACPGEPIAVSAKDPLALYEALAPALTARRITVAVRAQKTFAETDFGKTYLALARVRRGGVPWDRAALSDVLHSSFLHIPKQDVWRWDRRLRNDRLIDRDTVLAELRGDAGNRSLPFSRAFRLLDDLVTRTGTVDLNDFRNRYRSRENATTPAYVQEQCAAIGALGQLSELTARLGATAPDALEKLLTGARFSVSCTTLPAKAPRQPDVAIMSLRQAAELMPGSRAGLIACDLTSADYPLSDRRSAADILLEKLEAAPFAEPPLARERRRFAALVRVPRQLLVLERRLNDAGADPLYPSAMWEEFVDAYRNHAHLDSADDLDDTYCLPPNLREQRMDGGEEDAFRDVCPGMTQDALALERQAPPVPEHIGGALPNLLFPYPSQDPDRDVPRLSPSQLDDYLDCPFRWFATRGLNTQTLDEDQGPAARGTFLHQVFQTFYRTFGKKVTRENLPEAEGLMFGEDGGEGVFDRVVQAQRTQRPGNRYAALPDTTEERDVDALRLRVSDWLRFETSFLPGFTPVAFEYPIAFDYAGCRITGRIDRIDMDGQGNAVVIDYKGAMRAEYRALEADGRGKDAVRGFRRHGKVQGLVYAAALERAGMLRIPPENGFASQTGTVDVPLHAVVGALYASYNKGNRVSGAYLESVISSAADVPTLDGKDDCGLGPAGPLSFAALQQHVEQRAAEAVAGMRAGNVAPAPASKRSCEFCPIMTCEMRH